MSTPPMEPTLDDRFDVQAALRAELVIAALDAGEIDLDDVREPSPQIMISLALWASLALQLLAEERDQDLYATRMQVRRRAVETTGNVLALVDDLPSRKEG